MSTAPERVWEALADSEGWLRWWPWLIEAEVLAEGGKDGIGRTVRHRVSSPAGYRLGYVGMATLVEEPRLLEFVTIGELEGTGRFRLDGSDGGSRLELSWLVETPRAWMNLLAPLAKQVFIWSHHRLMGDFAAGLAKEAGGGLGGVDSTQRPRADPDFFNLPR